MKKIIVIGSSNVDMVVRTSHLPAPGETILGGEFFMNQGGKGANQAVAIKRSDVFIEENMMTLNRVVKSGETYTVTSQDYISSNEEKKTKSITLEAFSTDLKEKQMRLTYEKGISDTVPKILRPKQVVGEKADHDHAE